MQSSLARAAAAPAAGGLVALLARLRPHRAILASAALLCVSGFALWQWNDWLNAAQQKAPRTSPAASAGQPKAEPAAAGRAMEVSVHFILVPEAEAAAIMADRWTSDADTALLASVLQKAGPDPRGIHVARSFTETCRSGQRYKFENIKEVPWPTNFDHGENGMVTPREFYTRNVGSTAELELTVSEDDVCAVNLNAEHHYAGPHIHHFGTSLTKPEDESLPGAKTPEFRVASTATQLLLKPGESQIASCCQLPRLPDASADTPEQRLFTFVTIHSPSQP